MKSLREKKSWVNDYEAAKTLFEDLEVLYEFFKEDEATMEQVEERFEKAHVDHGVGKHDLRNAIA